MKWFIVEVWNRFTCTLHLTKVAANSAKEAVIEVRTRISHDPNRVIMGVYKEAKGWR